MQHEQVDPDTELFARALIQAGGADPDTIVQPGNPVIFGTPQGNAVKVNPDTLQPLWRCYIGAAKIGLNIARAKFAPTQAQAPAAYPVGEPVTPPKPNGPGLAPGAVDAAMGL